jgi:hypothetical protein
MEEEDKIKEDHLDELYTNEWDEMVNELEFLRHSKEKINKILD